MSECAYFGFLNLFQGAMEFSYKDQQWHSAAITSESFLVTGGAGFIGSHIVEYLLVHGAMKVRVLDNFSLGFKSNLTAFENDPAFELMEGDIRDVETCKKAMQGIDAVCHLAALGSVPRSILEPLASHATNVTGFLNVLNAAREAGIASFVYASSSAVYGDSDVMPRTEAFIGNPLSPYALTKWQNEEYAQLFSRVYGFHTTGLRFFNVFGPRQNPDGAYAAVIPRFFKAALQNQEPEIYGDGSVSRDFTYVANVVQVCIRALCQPPAQHTVYNAACGASTSVLELWQQIAAVTGSPLSPKFMPARKGDVQQSMANVEKVGRGIGYVPVVELEEGLQLTGRYYEEVLGR